MFSITIVLVFLNIFSIFLMSKLYNDMILQNMSDRFFPIIIISIVAESPPKNKQLKNIYIYCFSEWYLI